MQCRSFSLEYSRCDSKETRIKDMEMTYDFGDTVFELSDTMAEELIHLAVAMALENVESQRLQTSLSTLPLEA